MASYFSSDISQDQGISWIVIIVMVLASIEFDSHKRQ